METTRGVCGGERGGKTRHDGLWALIATLMASRGLLK